ncbi:hypothetical protein ACI65C_005066 [Semiaphis heraclei]
MAEAQSNSEILKKGDEFCSLVDLEKAIQKFEESENCDLSKILHEDNRREVNIKVGLMGYVQIKVADSNGQSEIVGYCILTSEDLETVTHIASVLKNIIQDGQKSNALWPTKTSQKEMFLENSFPNNILKQNDISTLELPTLPPRVPKRGHPKGKDKTAIGVAKRKKVSGLVPFEKLDTQTRHLEMLNWFVDKNVASIAVSGNAIENNPNNIHCADLDSYLVIDDIRRYNDIVRSKLYGDGYDKDFVSSSTSKPVENSNIYLDMLCAEIEDDDINFNTNQFNVLQQVVEDIVEYIAGFIVRKLSRKLICDECTEILTRTNTEKGSLINIKSRGG